MYHCVGVLVLLHWYIWVLGAAKKSVLLWAKLAVKKKEHKQRTLSLTKKFGTWGLGDQNPLPNKINANFILLLLSAFYLIKKKYSITFFILFLILFYNSFMYTSIMYHHIYISIQGSIRRNWAINNMLRITILLHLFHMYVQGYLNVSDFSAKWDYSWITTLPSVSCCIFFNP